jgi:hypothetical protein
VRTLLLLLLLAQPLGRPLYYWGARPATIVTTAAAGEGIAAQVTEVHGVVDRNDLTLRLSFDRPVNDAVYLPSGAPVSGRLRAALYVDADEDLSTGWAVSPGDARGGADYRVDVGVLALGADPGEGIEAQAIVTASLFELTPDGRQRNLWRGDHTANPERLSIRGDAIELRLPGEMMHVTSTARLTLIVDDEAFQGRLKP